MALANEEAFISFRGGKKQCNIDGSCDPPLVYLPVYGRHNEDIRAEIGPQHLTELDGFTNCVAPIEILCYGPGYLRDKAESCCQEVSQ